MNFVKNFAILTINKNHIRKSIYLIYKYILEMKMKSLFKPFVMHLLCFLTF